MPGKLLLKLHVDVSRLCNSVAEIIRGLLQVLGRIIQSSCIWLSLRAGSNWSMHLERCELGGEGGCKIIDNNHRAVSINPLITHTVVPRIYIFAVVPL